MPRLTRITSSWLTHQIVNSNVCQTGKNITERTMAEPYQVLYRKLGFLGWKYLKEPNMNFYQDPMDTGIGPDQNITFRKEGYPDIVVTTDYTLRKLIKVRKA
jgi:hypothetical protein